MVLKAAAFSRGGSGLIKATAEYRGSSANGNFWKVVAKGQRNKVIATEEQWPQPFDLSASKVAQHYADTIYGKLYPLDYSAVRKAIRQMRNTYPGIVLILIDGVYEAWDQDAAIVAQSCGVPLDERTVDEETFPVARVLAEAIFSTTHKLVQDGHRVNLAEQFAGNSVERVAAISKTRKRSTLQR